MAALIPFVPPLPPVFQWMINAARQLIAERRNIHQQFERISNRHHVNALTIIANRVFAATGFAATPRQCSTKWNALKRGYENLSRIINNNDDDIPIVSPNSFDRACFADMNMNDEFWLQT
ncbi:19552_t:CDS:1, partial [Rhizophagus irregularis]